MRKRVEKQEPQSERFSKQEARKRLKAFSKKDLINIVINLSNKIDRHKEVLEAFDTDAPQDFRKLIEESKLLGSNS